MQVLVDSSIWIDYFRSGESSSYLDMLIDENIIVVNDMILAELIPFMKIKKQYKLIKLLEGIQKISLDINWKEIVHSQTQCLIFGANGMGIPDLIIAQNARQHQCMVYSLDRHFQQLHRIIQVDLFQGDT